MAKSKLLPLLLVGFCVVSSSSYARTITQGQFLDQLRQTHPLFEREELTARIEQEEQNSYLGAEDWTVFSSLNFSHEEPAIAIAGPDRTDALYVNGGVERLFWRTGGRFSASFSSSWSDMSIDPSFGFPESFYGNQIEMAYAHPLVRNRSGFLDRLQFELKQFDIDFSEAQALENQEDFLAIWAVRFLDWVFLTEQRRIVAERLSLSEEELARTKRKREANLVDQVDVIRAEDAVRIGTQNQVLVESQWNAIRAELAVLAQDENIYEASPAFNLYEIIELPALEDAMSQWQGASRIIESLNIRLEQLAYTRQGFVEQSRPDLWLVAEVNTKNSDELIGESLVMDKPDAAVSLQFSVPWENRTAKSQIAKTDLKIAQIEKQLDEITLGVQSAVTNLYMQITEMEDVLDLNREQIESARQKTEEELNLYNQGRGDLTFVIQSRDNEENAKLTHALNALTYHKLVIEYRSLLDQLL
jgi:outer membrane protein TolC